MALSPAETAALIGLLGTVGMAAVGFGYSRMMAEIDEKADEGVTDKVDDLEESHRETRRMAEAAYATVHGDDDRPEDTGFIVETEERWTRLEREVDDMRQSVTRLERAQERHQQKTEVVLDAVAEHLDVDFVFRGPQFGDGGGGDGDE